ncbi:uracil-DNA glycosylase [Sporosarcina sp. HYO08]|uniref:uracil-DNA glycosylase n=1 Tax=Sporosarcina sp. HYO08 TaxID=1759557 RepID=UPI000797483E|nr:uracil-DNA glycosylase [Sporosarcina sp. HYO08]KXH87107.1 uracil-DNA glycosylase [Sporosarcina sp. HYO08]
MSNFCPIEWRKDPTPPSQIDCPDCGLLEHGTRMVWGEGNPAAPIMIILDNPGAREDREGNSFVCGTRQTLQKALHEVGFSPSDLYVTFIIKRKPTRAYDKEQTRATCMHKHLLKQLKENKPLLIICLGNIAVQSFFENQEAEVKTFRGKWHQVHGYRTAVAYHPLAVRRRPNLWKLFIEDLSFVSTGYQTLKKGPF